MAPDRMPGWQRLLAGALILVGAGIADPIGHLLARPTTVGGVAAPVVVPILFFILLGAALAMALIGPAIAYTAQPLGWPEWLAAVLAGLVFAFSGIAIYWLGASGVELRLALGVVIVHAAAWWYVLQWRRFNVGPPAGEPGQLRATRS